MYETGFNFFYSYAHLNSALDLAIIFLAKYFPLVILLALFVYLFEHRDNPRKGIRDLFVVGGTAVFAYATAYVFKDFFQTLRPFDALTSVKPLISESGHAFPSGHATFFMALAASLWYYHKRLGVLFGISAVVIGCARVAAGVHWPVDILGGLFFGYIVGTTLHKLITTIIEKKTGSQ